MWQCNIIFVLLLNPYLCIRNALGSDFFHGGRNSHFFFNGQSFGNKRQTIDNEEYYNCLRIKRGADVSLIKKAYRKLAVKYHPDKVGGSEEKFKELGEAYAVLSDPEKRRIYDQFGKDGLKDGTGFQQAENTSDFAEEIFSALFGARGRRSGGNFRSSKAPDTTYEIEVPLSDLYTGSVRRVRIFSQKIENGFLHRAPRDVNIVILPGMKTGEAIVMEGGQDPGIKGVVPGNLIFVVKESQTSNEEFRRIGDHLVTDVTVTLLESLLGFARPITHIDGSTIVIRSEGKEKRCVIKPNDFKVLHGKGMPIYGKPGQYGDLYVKFSVTFPTNEEVGSWSDEQVKLLASVLPKPSEYSWGKVEEASDETRKGIVGEPDPLVVRTIERKRLGNRFESAEEEHGSFFRFFGL